MPLNYLTQETPSPLSHSKHGGMLLDLLAKKTQAFILLFPDMMSKLQSCRWADCI